MLEISAQRLTGPQITLTTIIKLAAVNSTGVTQLQWNDFNNYAQWRNPYYLVYRDYTLNSPYILSAGMLAYFKLDGNNTNSVVTTAMTEANITYSSGNGKINSGAGFNGTSSYIRSTNSFAFSSYSAISVNLWVKFTTSGTQIFIEASPTFATNKTFIVYTSGGAIYCGISTGSGTNNQKISTFTVNDGNWHMITLVANLSDPNVQSKVSLYIDSVWNGTAPTLANVTGNFTDQAIFIGARNTNDLRYTGAIDELGIWPRVLSQSEITILYNAGAGIQYPF